MWECQTGKHVAVPRKQRDAGCQTLMLIGFRQWVRYLLSQRVRLPYALQVKPDCRIRKYTETTDLAVVHLYDCPQSLIVHYMWAATKGQTSCHEILEPTPVCSSTHVFIHTDYFFPRYVRKRQGFLGYSIPFVN